MLNKVTLIGNLGKDPEMRETMSGDRVANFSIATTEKYKKNGEVVENVEWHNCAAFGKDRKSTRLNSSHVKRSRMPSSA